MRGWLSLSLKHCVYVSASCLLLHSERASVCQELVPETTHWKLNWDLMLDIGIPWNLGTYSLLFYSSVSSLLPNVCRIMSLVGGKITTPLTNKFVIFPQLLPTLFYFFLRL